MVLGVLKGGGEKKKDVWGWVVVTVKISRKILLYNNNVIGTNFLQWQIS